MSYKASKHIYDKHDGILLRAKHIHGCIESITSQQGTKLGANLTTALQFVGTAINFIPYLTVGIDTYL